MKYYTKLHLILKMPRSTRSSARSNSTNDNNAPLAHKKRGRKSKQNPNIVVESDRNSQNTHIQVNDNDSNWSSENNSRSGNNNVLALQPSTNPLMLGINTNLPASLQTTGTLASIAGTMNPSNIPKIVENIVPTFDGDNLSVKMFIDHCKAAVMMVHPQDLPCLTMLIRTKIVGEARKHIQDRIGMRLEDILKTLEQIYSTHEDVGELCQKLGNIKRNTGESVPEYGGRVHQILNKIISITLESMPNEKGVGRCEAYKDTAIGNFIRGLDRDIFMQLNGKLISDLDEAISLATKLDATLQSWKRANGEDENNENLIKRENNDNVKSKQTPVKRVAHVKVENDDSKRKKVQCDHCKKLGHVKNECRKLGKSGNSERTENNENITCYYCSRKGHKSNQCFLKKKHTQERNHISNANKIKNEQKNENGNEQEGETTFPNQKVFPISESSSAHKAENKGQQSQQ